MRPSQFVRLVKGQRVRLIGTDREGYVFFVLQRGAHIKFDDGGSHLFTISDARLLERVFDPQTRRRLDELNRRNTDIKANGNKTAIL